MTVAASRVIQTEKQFDWGKLSANQIREAERIAVYVYAFIKNVLHCTQLHFVSSCITWTHDFGIVSILLHGHRTSINLSPMS